MGRPREQFGEVPGSMLENLLKTYHESVLYVLNTNIVGGEACSTPVQPRTTKKPLSRLKNLKAKGCCLVGHPQYYRQFGFKNVEGLVHEGVPQEVFFAFSFDGNIPQGNVLFHEGFKTNG
jgi:hypothetical protein